MGILDTIIGLLILLWLIGYFGFGALVGNVVHLLLVLILAGVAYRLITGRRL